MRVNRRQYPHTLAQADAGNAAPLVNLVGRAVVDYAASVAGDSV